MSAVFKSYVLMAAFLVLVVALGYVFSIIFASPGILYFAVTFSLVMNFFAYWFSDKVALALSRARPLTQKEAPHVYEIVGRLTKEAQLPFPKLYIIDSAAPNAFATGRNPKHSAVAVTRGILDRLNLQELEGVLAHELSHIKNRDILVATIAVVLAGFIAMLSHIFFRMTLFGGFGGGRRGGNVIAILAGLVAIIFAPLAATLMRLAISRHREFGADASGARLTKKPEELASALQKIAADPRPLETATNATAHLFIANPFSTKGGSASGGKGKAAGNWLVKLFSTHPPMEERVNALRRLKI